MPPVATARYLVARDGGSVEVTDSHPLPPLVETVQPDSAASEAGVLPGDVVTAVDGVPVTTFSQLRELVGGSDGSPLRLGLLRDGQAMELDLQPRRVDLPLAEGGFETRWLIGRGRTRGVLVLQLVQNGVNIVLSIWFVMGDPKRRR